MNITTIISLAGLGIVIIQFILLIGMKYGDLKNLIKTMERVEMKTNDHAERIARIEGYIEQRRDSNV